MIINVPIFKAYGHGEFLGISKSVKCFEGSFPMNSGVAVLSFDNKKEALRCLQSKTQIRETDWMGAPEMYIVPLCNPIKNMNGRYFSSLCTPILQSAIYNHVFLPLRLEYLAN